MAFTQSPSLHWATSLRFFNCLICTMVTVLWHLLSIQSDVAGFFGEGFGYDGFCDKFYQALWYSVTCDSCDPVKTDNSSCLEENFGYDDVFFDKLTVICDTTWHVTVVTVCRVTMQGAMGGGRGLTPAATKSRAFHTEQLEQAPQPRHFHRSPSLHCGDHQPQCACESPLGVNWVIEIGAWGGCVPLLETAERGTRDRPVGGAGGTI